MNLGAKLRALIQERYLPLGLLLLAAVLLVSSIALPYWNLMLHAPQYPKGLPVTVYVTHLSGQVKEVDGLNHYIGMMKLNEAARFERAVAPFAIPVVALLVVASFWAPGRWKWLLVLPALIFPLVFIGDLAIWLYYAGHHLDKHAALSSAIKPFTPHVFGVGRIGQFSTEASFGIGFYFIVLGALLATAATVIERRGLRRARPAAREQGELVATVSERGGSHGPR